MDQTLAAILDSLADYRGYITELLTTNEALQQDNVRLREQLAAITEAHDLYRARYLAQLELREPDA